MVKLNPVEYEFVTSPLLSDGEGLLKLTLQYLCLKDVIQIEQRWIAINSRERRKRLRFFFLRGKHFDNYRTEKKSERFLLELFYKLPEFRFYVLRQHVKNHFGKQGTDLFKSDYVMKDLRNAGLTIFRYLPNFEAKTAAKEITVKLKLIDRSVDQLIKNDHNQLTELLHQLGPNILLLKPETIEKINSVSEDIQKIRNLNFFAILNSSFIAMDAFFYGDFGGFDSFDGGGFGGFDGGDFGGGGAGGDW